MRFDPFRHHRRSIRLRTYDYSRDGAYFITACVHNRECLLGEIADGIVTLSEIGQAVERVWLEMPTRFPGVVLDDYVLMPNHFHAILFLTEPPTPDTVGAGLALPSPVSSSEEGRASPAPTRVSLGRVVGAFKSLAAREANRLLDRTEQPFWHRNYYEHVIRDEPDCERIRTYIHQNPAQWADDSENPVNIAHRSP